MIRQPHSMGTGMRIRLGYLEADDCCGMDIISRELYQVGAAEILFLKSDFHCTLKCLTRGHFEYTDSRYTYRSIYMKSQIITHDNPRSK